MTRGTPHISPDILKSDIILFDLLEEEQHARRKRVLVVAARLASAIIGASLGAVLALAILMWINHVLNLS